MAPLVSFYVPGSWDRRGSVEMGLTCNQKHPCCHPHLRAVPWAGVYEGLPLGGSLCARPPLKQVGPACQAARRCEGPRTMEAAVAGARLAGAISPRRPQLSGDRVSSRPLPPRLQQPSRQAKPVTTPGSSAPTRSGS